jgi:hypothetical protein
MRALDLQDDPAVGPIGYDEVQDDLAVIVDEGDRGIGLVGAWIDRNRADPPFGLCTKIVGLNAPMPASSVRIGSRWRIARQAVGEIEEVAVKRSV